MSRPRITAAVALLACELAYTGGRSALAQNAASATRNAQPAPYAALVLNRLARQQRYPAEAWRQKREGVVRIAFKVGGDGRVFDVSVIRSSGFGALDSEAQAMVWRAHPFPPPPDHGTRSLVAPISFKLSGKWPRELEARHPLLAP
jgi:protein TonB